MTAASTLPLEQWSAESRLYWCLFSPQCGKHIISDQPQNEQHGWIRFRATPDEINELLNTGNYIRWSEWYRIRVADHVSSGWYGVNRGAEILAGLGMDGLWYGLLPGEGMQIVVGCRFEILAPVNY